MDKQAELAWNMLTELRQEMLSSQRIRAQIIGFKITFVSTAIALIVANLDKVNDDLLVIPAFASVFFDLLIAGQSVGIKRIAYYCRHYLEPKLRIEGSWPNNDPLWHEFVSFPERRQSLSIVGNLGMTTLAFFPAIASLLNPFRASFSLPMIGLLLGFYAYAVFVYILPRKIYERRSNGKKTRDGKAETVVE